MMNWNSVLEIIKSPKTYMAFVIGLGGLLWFHYKKTGDFPHLTDENVFLSSMLVLFGISFARMLWDLISISFKQATIPIMKLWRRYSGRLKKNIDEIKVLNEHAYVLLLYANDRSPHDFCIPSEASYVQAVRKLIEWNYVHILGFSDSIDWDTSFSLTDKGAVEVYDYVSTHKDKEKIERFVLYVERAVEGR